MEATTITIRDKIQNILKVYHKAVIELFQSLTDVATQATTLNIDQSQSTKSPTDIMKKVVEKEIELNQAFKELEEHQQFQLKIQDVQKEIEKKDKIIFEIAVQLRKAEAILQQIVEDGKKQLEIIEQSQKAGPDVASLIAYAHKISATTAAPQGWTQGTPLVMFRPPAPREDEMRSGLLYNEVPLKSLDSSTTSNAPLNLNSNEDL